MTDEQAIKVLTELFGETSIKASNFQQAAAMYEWLAALPDRLRSGDGEDTDGGDL